LIVLLLAFLCGCKNKEITVYQDEDLTDFDHMLENIGDGTTKAYDLRLLESCREGRIPGFFCARTVNSQGEVKTLARIRDDLKLLLGKDYGRLIILMDESGEEASQLASMLFAEGFYNIHYFQSGYQRYVELKGNTFVPETGECNAC
jgi:hypothetical protein